MNKDWLQVARVVWDRKWEAVLGILGLVAALVAGIPLYIGLPFALITALLIVDIVREIRGTVSLLREKHVPLIVIVGKDDDEFHAMLDNVRDVMKPFGFNEREFDTNWDIERDDLVVRRESRLPRQLARWKDLTDKFEKRVARVRAKLQGRTIFHLFLNCPAALAVGLGARLCSRYEVVLHHWLPRYTPVIDLSRGQPSVHTIKQRITQPFQYITVESPGEWTEEVVVSIHLAAHGVRGAAEALARERSIAALHISNTYGGSLTQDADWLRVAQEVNTELFRLLGSGVKRVHLCLSAPVVLAFAIGMALGTQSAVTVYNWFDDKQAYFPVLELEQLRG